MKLINKGTGFLLFMLMISIKIHAQTLLENTLNLQAMSMIDEDNYVLLRWAPINSSSWEYGNENGYRIYRFLVTDSEGNIYDPEVMMASGTLIASGLKPIPEGEWQALAASSEPAGLAAAAIYGERFDIEPLDTGDYGSVYGATEEKENRFGFGLFAADQEFEVAQNMGLAYKDKTVESGKTYMYRIGFENVPDSIVANVATIEKEVIYLEENLAPQDLELLPGDSLMQLSWTYDVDAPYTSYLVERSENGGETFTQVNLQPIVYAGPNGIGNNIFYANQLPNNTQTFTYRVRGKNAFGIVGPASGSMTGKGMPSPIDGPLNITEAIGNEDETNTIVWELPTEQESAIEGFKVLRSDLRNGIYESLTPELLPVSRRTFSDSSPLYSSYYKIVAVDMDEQEVASLSALIQIEDSTPPGIPTGLSGTCATSGAVTLTWDENTESDMLGYRVFVSNQKNGYYTQVSETWLREPIFYYDVDMDNAAEEIYFKVLALDKRENPSNYSEPCTVVRPDIHPPSPPALKTIEALAAGVSITWVPSSASDVVMHRLERKPAYDNTWRELVRFEGTGNFSAYLDSTATGNMIYTYRLIAVDANLESSSLLKSIHPLTVNLVDGITDLMAEILINEKKVFLSWNYDYNNLIYGFDIYRSVDSDTYRHFKTVKKEDCFTALLTGNTSQFDNYSEYTYIDDELVSQSRIKYKIQVQYIDGRTSKLSDPVILLLQ